MKYLKSKVAVLILLFPLPIFAAPIKLLDCFMDSALMQTATVYLYMNRLFIFTKPTDGDGSSRILDRAEWESKELVLQDNSDFKALLYKKENGWYFLMKDPSGWSLAGNASCAENLEQK